MRRWRKSLAISGIVGLLLGVPLLSLRAGTSPVTIVYLEGAADGEVSHVVLEPLQPDDEDPSDERVVWDVPHERGFLPRGALSPDGRTVALVRQPRGRPEREAAEAILLDVEDGTITVLPVPAFGPLMPVFATSGPPRVYVTSAEIAPGPPPTDDEMRGGRLRPYDFTIWEVDRTSLTAGPKIEQRLTWLHPIGVALVRLGPQSNPAPALVVYRVTHGGADLSAIGLVGHDPPVNIANLGFAMARDFDISEDGDALIFLSRQPGAPEAQIQTIQLALGGQVLQQGNDVAPDASPRWARSFREWFFARRPARVGREEPPLRVHRASNSVPLGRALDSLTSLTGVAEGPEVPLENGAAPDGRFLAVRTDPGTGPLFFLRDTAQPQSARILGDGGLIRVLGFQ